MIRLAVPEDFTSIMSIYAYARSFMQETGNPESVGKPFSAGGADSQQNP